jgi:nickel-type superoxide dismutase maturation protease
MIDMTPNKDIHPTLPAPSWREWGLWLLRQRMRVRVTGDSMLPTVMPNDIVLVDTHAYTASIPKVGEIVLVHHPYQKDLKIIKRVAEITPEGRLVLHSDNRQAGSDSRQFGTISTQRLIGRVTCRSAFEDVQ